MLKALKRTTLSTVRAAGAFDAFSRSRWRGERLLILCYHGISLCDEHLWNEELYLEPERFYCRLELLRRGGYAVLPLGEALQMLYTGNLPPRAIAITFDDGTYDFCVRAFPALKSYGFPATVYLTTYYSEYNVPVFDVICSYLLWRSRQDQVNLAGLLANGQRFAITSPAQRQRLVALLLEHAKAAGLTGEEKEELAGELARRLGLDYSEIKHRRILHLMRPAEVGELASSGIDFQLHTHRHRTPRDRAAFHREIDDNRLRIQQITGKQATHFCYPSGQYRIEFLPWLREREVASATTCEPGFATRSSNPLLLPRLVDVSSLSDLEFESWLAGVGPLLPRRRTPRPSA